MTESLFSNRSIFAGHTTQSLIYLFSKYSSLYLTLSNFHSISPLAILLPTKYVLDYLSTNYKWQLSKINLVYVSRSAIIATNKTQNFCVLSFPENFRWCLFFMRESTHHYSILVQSAVLYYPWNDCNMQWCCHAAAEQE